MRKIKITLPVLSIMLIATLCLAGEQDAQSASNPPQKNNNQPQQKITLSQSVVLGVVEGLTEYLPVSSTGHLILASHAMDLTEFSDEPGPMGPKLAKNQAIDSFEVVIQLGAILAVLGLYRRRIGQMSLGVIGRNPAGLRLIGLLGVAFLPAMVLGLALHEPITEYLFGPYTVAGALIVGGVAMIIVEKLCRRGKQLRQKESHLEQMRYWQAFAIGLAQCLAMWPGTSRSMVTILVAVVVGLNFITAAEFSFLLALPTLGGATIYAATKNWDGLMDAAGWDTLLLGTAISAIAAAIAVKAFVKWLTNHGMIAFGVYRIILGLAVFAYFARMIRL